MLLRQIILTSIVSFSLLSLEIKQFNFSLQASADTNKINIVSDDNSIVETQINNPQETVVQLQQQGEKLYREGSENEAFAIWYRELEIRKQLGTINELEALTRIGGIAWQDNRKEDLQNIATRTIEIETESIDKIEKNIELLSALGATYRQIRSLDRAIIIYQKIWHYNRDKKDINGTKLALEDLAELYLTKFDYPNAVKILEELLNIARSSQDSEKERVYLLQIIDSYSYLSQSDKSLNFKQQLLEIYQKNRQQELIPQLQISIAEDYRNLDRPQEADRAYQEAFNLSWSLQQYAIAADALNGLGNLYLAYNERESALKIYEELLKIERETADYYSSLDTYDRLGKINLELKNFDRALMAFELGLKVAKSLKYREEYFQQQIELVEKELEKN